MSLDVNGDGSLTFEEIKKGLEGKDNAETILQIMQSADTDGSGEINYTEFLAATMDANVFMREDYLRTAFNMFDKDNSGFITKEELMEVIQARAAVTISPKQIDQMMMDSDENNDGLINYEEFIFLMTK